MAFKVGDLVKLKPSFIRMCLWDGPYPKDGIVREVTDETTTTRHMVKVQWSGDAVAGFCNPDNIMLARDKEE